VGGCFFGELLGMAVASKRSFSLEMAIRLNLVIEIRSLNPEI
jgi:hypothetical protein